MVGGRRSYATTAISQRESRMTKRTARIVVFRDKKKEWRWQLKSANGKIVAESGEGLSRKPSPQYVSSLAAMFCEALDHVVQP